MTDIVTPVNVDVLETLLKESLYDELETRFIVNGFRFGFPLEYAGPRNLTRQANNLPLNCGTKTQLWNKVMKEVQLGRYAGPFEEIPFTNYVQSPIGLVPKQGNDVRCHIY